MKKRFLAFILSVVMLTGLVSPFRASAVDTNLITNPSVETTDATGTKPLNWQSNKWGTNTATFTYKTDEGYNSLKSLYINMTQRVSGDAKWYFTHIPVKANQKYTISNFYKSNVSTEVDIEYLSTNNQYSYVWLGTPAASITNWQQNTYSFTTPTNVKSLTIFHVINRVGWLQTDGFSLTEVGASTANPTPPTVSLTTPAANTTVSGATQAVSASATDSSGVAGVQFKLDGINLGAEDTVAPYSVNWDTTKSVNGSHTLSATARNSAGLTATTFMNVSVQNIALPTPPTVSITAPTANATVSGSSQAISANASDSISIAAVQFQVDGVNLGSEDTTAPYSVNWDTTKSINGSHTLSATARNSSGLTATTNITVNVQNSTISPIIGTNLIANPSFESGANTPDSWLSEKWGTNTTTFAYLATGHTGTKSVKADVTAYTNGASNWYYPKVNVTAGKSYKYENWYQSNVDTEIDAEVLMSDGTTQYFYVTIVPASTSWAKASATFTAPISAKSMIVYQLIAKKGYLITDDYSLTEYIPASFNRGIVSLTFDDSWRSIYTNGLPLLKKYNFVSTQYLLTGITSDPEYMTVAMMQAFKDQGSEIASHTVSHPHLPQLSVANMDVELANSQASLRQWFGASVAKNFATPYGEYNSTVLTEIKKYYQSHRSVEEGFNTKDSYNIYNIKVQNVTSSTTQAQLQAWVDQASKDKTWLVLVYHEIGANIGGDIYHTDTASLDQHMAYIKQVGIVVRTVEQAIAEIQPQL